MLIGREAPAARPSPPALIVAVLVPIAGYAVPEMVIELGIRLQPEGRMIEMSPSEARFVPALVRLPLRVMVPPAATEAAAGARVARITGVVRTSVTAWLVKPGAGNRVEL